MILQEKLNDLSNRKDFNGLAQLLENGNAKIDLTFWGTRTITVGGLEGCMDFDVFVEIVKNKFRDNDNNGFCDSVLNKRKIAELYKEGDKLVEEANCITKFFNALQEFKLMIVGPWPSNRWWFPAAAV
jgi:hypothetical protein